MAQIVEFVGNDPDSGKLFTLGSDVVVATAASVAPATNRKSIFAASFSGVAVGEYQFIALDGAEGDAIWTVAITSADGVFTAYERTVNTSAGASNGTVTRSLTDTEPIQFSWPVTGATLTGEVDFNSANDYQSVLGTFDFLYTEGGVHYYTLSHNAADRPTVEGTARYKVTDGVRTKWFNLRMAVSSGGGGEADWTAEEREQIRYRLGLDGDNSAPVGVTPDPIVVTPGTGNSTTGYYTVLDKHLDPEPGVTVYAKMLDAYDTDTGFIYSGEVLTSVSNAYGVCEFTMIKGASYRCWRNSPTPTAPISLIVVPLDAGTTTPLKSLVRI